MEKFSNAKASEHQLKLIMMGAKVQMVNSKLCYVKFNLTNFDVAYVYNINKHNRYFLERVKPYPLTFKDYEIEADVIKEIEHDILHFKNAALSKNIKDFIQINKDLSLLMKEFEDSFLHYNIPREDLVLILNDIKKIHQELIDVKNKSKRI